MQHNKLLTIIPSHLKIKYLNSTTIYTNKTIKISKINTPKSSLYPHQIKIKTNLSTKIPSLTQKINIQTILSLLINKLSIHLENIPTQKAPLKISTLTKNYQIQNLTLPKENYMNSSNKKTHSKCKIHH